MSNPPFPLEPTSGQAVADLRTAVQTTLRRGESAIAVTGLSREEQAVLCRDLAASTDDLSFSTGLFDPTLDPEATLVQLLNDFGLSAGRPVDGSTHQLDSLSQAVTRFLRSLRPLAAHAVIVQVIGEAVFALAQFVQ